MQNELLVLKALFNGWRVDDRKCLYLPEHPSETWAACWREINVLGYTVLVPDWLERVINETLDQSVNEDTTKTEPV